MYQPEAYGVALLFMLTSMLCWGSWANTMKLTKGWRFQLFYWDYALGVALMSLFLGLTLGNTHGSPDNFFTNLQQASLSSIRWAVLGGIVFNLANLLLVAAIEIAGLAVAFPIGIGLALIVGVFLNYLLSPRGNPLLLFGGVFLVLLAIILDALAYRRKEAARPQISVKGIGISLASGVLMGLFYPFVTNAMTGDGALGPYTVGFIFALGILACTVAANYLLMRLPIAGGPKLAMREYFSGRWAFHFWGFIGGAVWCTGTVLNFVAANARIVGPAVSYAIGQGATMVAALWGVFVWREFADAPPEARRMLAWMFLFFVLGLTAVAVAPLVKV